MEGIFAPLEIIGGLIALPYLLLPLLIRGAAAQATHPALTTIDAADLPPSLGEIFESMTKRLVACGFELEARLVHTGLAAANKTYIFLLRNAATGDHAIVVAMGATDTQPPKTAYVECATSLVDDTVFNTANTSVLPSFAPVPDTTSWKLPSVRDPARLYEIHRALVTRFGKTEERKARDKQAIPYLRSSMIRELDSQVRRGNYVVDELGARYVPTWRGAILMAWKALWPTSAVRRYLRDRRERRLLASVA